MGWDKGKPSINSHLCMRSHIKELFSLRLKQLTRSPSDSRMEQTLHNACVWIGLISQGDPHNNDDDVVSEKGDTTLSWRKPELQKPSFPTSPTLIIIKKCLHV